MLDEQGPSPEDLRRFSGTTAYCPECGSKVWDQAEVCPSCGTYLGGDTSTQPPIERWFRRRWMILVVLVMLAALLSWVLLGW